MKKTVTSLLLMWAIGSCSTSFLQAQTAVEKGLKSINRPSAEAIVGFLADDALQGREAGMIGSRVAARYLVSCLQEAGIAPLYDVHITSLSKPVPRNGSRKAVGRYTLIPLPS